MTRRTTLLTAHRNVDLHAATAERVMRDRLEGGDRLAALRRCELHTFLGEPVGVSAARLLDNGRYYNPNKHHYGHFVREGDADWPDAPGGALEAAWPGDAVGSDLAALAADGSALYECLLGGRVPAGCVAVDIAAWARDQAGPVRSGVLWRLVLRAAPGEAHELGELLAVARERKRGLLINPHMEAWRTAVR